jgi:hypothetical protein
LTVVCDATSSYCIYIDIYDCYLPTLMYWTMPACCHSFDGAVERCLNFLGDADSVSC